MRHDRFGHCPGWANVAACGWMSPRSGRRRSSEIFVGRNCYYGSLVMVPVDRCRIRQNLQRVEVGVDEN